MKPFHPFSFILIACAFCAGCISGPSGPAYKDFTTSGGAIAPSGKATVLIYWVSGEGSVSDNSNRSKLYLNNQMMEVSLRPGGFYSYSADPGSLQISSGGAMGSKGGNNVLGALGGGVLGVMKQQKKDHFVLDVKAGEVYYVETKSGFVHEKMMAVPKEEGERRIQKCHWLNANGSQPK